MERLAAWTMDHDGADARHREREQECYLLVLSYCTGSRRARGCSLYLLIMIYMLAAAAPRRYRKYQQRRYRIYTAGAQTALHRVTNWRCRRAPVKTMAYRGGFPPAGLARRAQ